MTKKIILASKSEVRKKILEKYNINCEVIPSNVNEDQVKESLLQENTTPELISKNLAELKANKVSSNKPEELVLGADSVIDLNGELISKPTSRHEAIKILQKLNGKKHQLISSVCISKNGSMIWNYTDKSNLTMKLINFNEIKAYLGKIRDKELYAYGVYQIEADGRSLFEKIEGDENSIMGLPVEKIKKYLSSFK
tara:strand:- start:2911 stop:3498 length:588 start_codon:yes stop_codon:yes gene_type:complete